MIDRYFRWLNNRQQRAIARSLITLKVTAVVSLVITAVVTLLMMLLPQFGWVPYNKDGSVAVELTAVVLSAGLMIAALRWPILFGWEKNPPNRSTPKYSMVNTSG